MLTFQSVSDWKENDLVAWMKAINLDVYQSHFQVGGVVRGSDLLGVDEGRLLELGITDDLHRLIIMECVDELIKGSSSLVSR